MDSTEHPGQPQRPPASAHLLIDSTDRYNTDPFLQLIGERPYANDFSIIRNQALLYGYFTRIGITQLQFYWNFPTIRTGYNDTIIFYKSAPTDVSGLIVLDEGFFTPTELAAEIEKQLQSAQGVAAGAGATYTAVWQQSSRSILIESNNGDEFSFYTPDTWPGTLSPAQTTNVYKAYKTLGMTGANLDGITPDTFQTLTTPSPPTDYVDIVSDRLTKFMRVKDGETLPQKNKANIIARVYVTPPNQRIEVTADQMPGSNPFYICVDYNTPKHMKWSPAESINQLDFQVYDMYGDLLPWNEVYNWEFQLTMLASET
jgi:hypothetical protein